MPKRKLPQLIPWEYNPTTLQALDLADLKGLYSQKRDIAQKRLKRLQQSEFAQSEQARKYPGGIPTIKELVAMSEGDQGYLQNILSVELANLNMWTENRYSLVSEHKKVRKLSIITLHKHGYDWINKDNYLDFVDFENYLDATNLDMLYDSDQPELSGDKIEPDTSKLKELFELFMQRGGSLPVEKLIRARTR